MSTLKPFRIAQRGFLEVETKHQKVPYAATKLPIRSDKKSAGYDFYSKEDIVLKPGKTYLFWTDVKAYMQDDEVLSIHVRSSIGIKHGLILANTTGIIDSSYFENKKNDGNIGICLRNIGDKTAIIESGERIAQGIFQKYLTIDEDQTLGNERTGGIGSSGK